MITKLPQNLWAKAETESWWLNLASFVEFLLFSSLILLLPTQFGKHFWFNFSIIQGLRIDYLSPTLYATDLLLVALFVLSLFQRKLIISPLFSLFVFFLGLNIYFSLSPFAGWYYFVKFLEISFLVFYISQKKFPYFLFGVLLSIGVLFESLIAFGQLLLQGSVGGVLYFFGERSFSASTPGIANASLMGQLLLRPYGTFSHPNMFAGYVVVTLFLLFYLLSGRRVFQSLFFITMIIGTMGISVSLSRTAVVSWLGGALIFIVSLSRKMTSRIIVISMLTVAIFPLLFPDILLRFLPFSFGQSITERAILVEAAMRMFFARPLFGVGFGNFLPTLSLFSANSVPLQPVHNIYLLVASELGVIGLGSFLWILWTVSYSLFLKVQRATIHEKVHLIPLLLALCAILFMGLFDHYWLTLQQGQLLFGLVLGLILRETAHATIET